MGYAQSTSTTFSITDKSAISVVTNGSGTYNVGYAKIVPGSGQTTPAGVAIFGYNPSGTALVTEAGVPASPLLKNGRIYAEVSSGGFAGPGTDIGLAMANSGTSDAVISFTYTNSSGVDVGGNTYTLSAGKQSAVFLDQAPWNVPLGFQGSFTFTSTAPISVVALQLYQNARSEDLITTLPVIDLDTGVFTPSTTPAVLPQFADGAAWTTSVLLVNPTDSTISGTIQFRDPSGNILSMATNSQTATSFAYTIPRRSSYKLVTAGTSNPPSPGAPQTGSVTVTPSAGGTTPVSLAVFSLSNGTTIVTQAGVTSSLSTSFRTYVEANAQLGAVGSYMTGVAVANASSAAGTITLDLFTPDGNPTAYSATLPITANGQFAPLLTTVFPTLTLPFQGVLRIRTSTSAISVVALRIRVNERGEYLQTTTPPTDENGSAPVGQEYDFPQIVNAGGFTTQFVLFSGYKGQATSGTLSFVSYTAQPLSLSLKSTINGVTPTLTSISPATAAQGSNVTLAGTGFSASSTVSFTTTTGPTSVTPTVQSSTSMTAVVPTNAITGPVQVANGSLTSTVVILTVTTSSGTPVQAPVTVTSSATNGVDIYVGAAVSLNPSLLSLQPAGFSGGAFSEQSTALEISRGATKVLIIDGSGMQSGATITISGSGVTMSGVQFSSGLVFGNIAVDSAATTGPRNIIVTNPNGDTAIFTGGIIIQ